MSVQFKLLPSVVQFLNVHSIGINVAMYKVSQLQLIKQFKTLSLCVQENMHKSELNPQCHIYVHTNLHYSCHDHVNCVYVVKIM